MGRFKPKAALTDSKVNGGYVSRTISKGYLSSIPVNSWAHSFHKPYANDWKESKEKAIEHCRSSAIVYEGGDTHGGIIAGNNNTKADNK